MFRKYVRIILIESIDKHVFEIYNKQYKEHMFADNCFEEMMEGYRMSTRRIYWKD